MHSKPRGVIAASVLAIAAAGGAMAAVRAMPTGVVPTALPAPTGTAAAARMPAPGQAGARAGAGDAGAAGSTVPPAPGPAATSTAATSTAATSTGATSTGATGTGAGTAGAASPAASPGSQGRPAPAGQGGQAGRVRSSPQPAGTARATGARGAIGAIPANGAVPGASPALRALAAARSGGTALPHSPRLLGELAGPSGWPPRRGAAGPGAASAPEAPGGPKAPTAPGTAAAPGMPGAAAAAGGPAAASAAPLPGIDVASFQHPVTAEYPKGAPISWREVAAAGYRYAAVKGTEGDYYVNPWAAADLAAAKAAGLDVTYYHFAIPNVSGGAQQARFALKFSGYAAGGHLLPPMLDIEYDPYTASDHTNECYGLTARQMVRWISAYVGTARKLTGQYPVIYTTADWWNACTAGSAAFGADPLWAAAYGVASPQLPPGWPAWTFWQHTSGGTVPGVDTPGATDLSWFNNPRLVGLIDPGHQASHAWARVTLRIGSLGALAGEPLTWSAAGLPRGLWISRRGVIAGTVTGSGSSLAPAAHEVTVTARNAAGATATVTFGWRVTASCASRLAAGYCPGGK